MREKKSAQIANRLSRKEIFYHLHSLRVKILFLHTSKDRCCLPPSKVLDILEKFRFSEKKKEESERSSRKLKELGRVYSIISDCIAAFKSIENWNYKAVYRHAWTVSKAAYMEQHCTLVHRDSYTLKSAVDLFDAMISKKVSVSSRSAKGANVLWNPKLIEYVEHLSKPRCKYDTVRYKVACTYVDICVNASYYQKLYELYSALKASKDDFSKDQVLMRSANLCLEGMVKILSESLKLVKRENEKSPLKASEKMNQEPERTNQEVRSPDVSQKVSSEAETMMKNSFVLYLESIELTCVVGATLAKIADNTLQSSTALLTDAFEKMILVDLKGHTSSGNDILSKAINFCDRIAPEHKGKVRLSKMKLRLKKRHKTKPSSNSSSNAKAKSEDIPPPPPPPPRPVTVSKDSAELQMEMDSPLTPLTKRPVSEEESKEVEVKKQKKEGIIITLKLNKNTG